MPDPSVWRRRLDRFKAEADSTERRIREETAALAAAEGRARAAAEAQAVALAAAEAVQVEAHRQVAAVVSRCLEAVFGEGSYGFKILFEHRRGKTEARFAFERGGVEVDPLGASGGGAVDVAAFGLRLAALLLSRPARRRLLILDEPFAHVKPPEVYGPRICTLLEELADELGMQFVLVPSAERHYQVGKVVSVGD